MVFIDIEKVYDRVLCKVLWGCLKKNRVSMAYVLVITDIYEEVNTSVSSSGGDTMDFPVNIGLHQVLTLNPFLFAIVMDKLTKGIQKIPWCMLFMDYIVLIDENIVGVNVKLERSRQTLKSRVLSQVDRKLNI